MIHVRAQLCYLIESEHGCLWAIGFAASALAVAARDQWIARGPAMRSKRPYRVAALSRFLIRPSVRCHLLAFTVLGRVLRRLPHHFRPCYTYRPTLGKTCFWRLFLLGNRKERLKRAAYPPQRCADPLLSSTRDMDTQCDPRVRQDPATSGRMNPT